MVMKPDQIKNILLAIVGSLASFLFYGYIETKDQLEKVDTRLTQAESELNDIWTKYNKEQDEKMNFIREFYKELDKKKDK
jgi:hypothetical protein